MRISGCKDGEMNAIESLTRQYQRQTWTSLHQGSMN